MELLDHGVCVSPATEATKERVDSQKQDPGPRSGWGSTRAGDGSAWTRAGAAGAGEVSRGVDRRGAPTWWVEWILVAGGVRAQVKGVAEVGAPDASSGQLGSRGM